MTTSDRRRAGDETRAYESERSAFDDNQQAPARVRGQVNLDSGTNLLAGLWLVVAPFVLNYSGVANAVWDDVVIGIVVATLAAVRVSGAYRQAWMSWTNATLGAWLIVAPWALSYSATHSAAANDVIVGAIVLTFGTFSATAGRPGATRA
jgi:SPW repeat